MSDPIAVRSLASTFASLGAAGDQEAGPSRPSRSESEMPVLELSESVPQLELEIVSAAPVAVQDAEAGLQDATESLTHASSAAQSPAARRTCAESFHAVRMLGAYKGEIIGGTLGTAMIAGGVVAVNAGIAFIPLGVLLIGTPIGLVTTALVLECRDLYRARNVPPAAEDLRTAKEPAAAPAVVEADSKASRTNDDLRTAQDSAAAPAVAEADSKASRASQEFLTAKKLATSCAVPSAIRKPQKPIAASVVVTAELEAPPTAADFLTVQA